MKSIVLLFALLVWSMTLSAQAKISFANTSIEFDNVKKGSNGNRSFVFTNSGNEALLIKKVESTSGLLEVSSPKNAIQPGKSGEIKINYDTNKTGPVRRTVTVFSNAENLPVVALKIKGNVKDE